MRIALRVEYDGTAYSGWERQRDRPTVQGALESALSRIVNQPVQTVCAGRTDAGVHAFGQIVHFDAPVERPLRAWVLGVNSSLSMDVSVSWADAMPPQFHARFSATARCYRYVILNRPARSAVLHHRVAWVHRPLDAGKMLEAASALVGTHDFSAFRAAGCQANTPVRSLTAINVRRRGALILIDVTANAFLQHMVRNIAGSLMAVGQGKREPGWLEDVLRSRDRTNAGVTAPPSGLYLMGVRYPQEFATPPVPRRLGLW